jgi:hypothetical protein
MNLSDSTFNLIDSACGLNGLDRKDLLVAHLSDMAGRKRIILKIFLGK